MYIGFHEFVGLHPKERTKVLLFFEKAFANRTNRLSNRTNLHFGGILFPILERCHPCHFLEHAVECLVRREATECDGI
jgi:hypothetical protein